MLTELITTTAFVWPLFFNGFGSVNPLHEWQLSRQTRTSNILITTNPSEWQCLTAYEEDETNDVYDVVKQAAKSPGILFGYNTSYSGRIEAHSNDGVHVRIRAHHPVVAGPMHDVCWILLMNDPTGAVTGVVHDEVQRLLTAINTVDDK